MAPDKVSEHPSQSSKVNLSLRQKGNEAAERASADPSTKTQADDHAIAANDLFKAAIDLVKR